MGDWHFLLDNYTSFLVQNVEHFTGLGSCCIEISLKNIQGFYLTVELNLDSGISSGYDSFMGAVFYCYLHGTMFFERLTFLKVVDVTFCHYTRSAYSVSGQWKIRLERVFLLFSDVQDQNQKRGHRMGYKTLGHTQQPHHLVEMRPSDMDMHPSIRTTGVPDIPNMGMHPPIMSLDLPDMASQALFKYFHPRDRSDSAKYACPQCDKSFSDARSLHYHREAIHDNVTFQCVCGKSYKYRTGLFGHRRTCVVYLAQQA